MAALDLVVRGGTVVTARELLAADIGIAEGRIVSFQPELEGPAQREIDATGLHILPGLIDAHVHFNEPGRTHWEGIETGSRALAAGGGTMFFDMPLNSSPPVLDAESFSLKKVAAEAVSLTDFALWGGLGPGNLDKLRALHACGVIGFKAFMCASGMEDFPPVDYHQLRAGMKLIAALNSILAVHAESEAMTRQLTEERLAHGITTVRDFLDSRPIEAELEAIKIALDLAGETGCALHVVHVSCGEGAALIAAARGQGVNVSCETCPHYLLFTDEDLLERGAVLKCAPPLRAAASQERLWRLLLEGQVPMVASDHSPSPPELKDGENFFTVWGGIAGVQHTLSLLIDQGHLRRGLPLPDLSRIVSLNVAARFRLPPEKGGLKIGGDADLTLVNLSAGLEVTPERMFQRHRLSPYAGMWINGQVMGTLVRGTPVFDQGEFISKPIGRLVKPLRT